MFQRFKWSVAIAKANKPLNLCFAFSCFGYSSLSLFLFLCFSLCPSCIRCIVKWRANICLIERMQQLINWPLIELSFALCFPPFLSLLFPSCLSLYWSCFLTPALSHLCWLLCHYYQWQTTKFTLDRRRLKAAPPSPSPSPLLPRALKRWKLMTTRRVQAHYSRLHSTPLPCSLPSMPRLTWRPTVGKRSLCAEHKYSTNLHRRWMLLSL